MSLYKDASLVMIPSAVKDGKLYSIRPTDGSGDFTFSRGSNLAATRVDVNGLIEKGRENLALQGSDISTQSGSWSANQGGVTTQNATTSPIGTNTASQITANGSNTYSGVRDAGIAMGALRYTYSVYLKAQSGTTDIRLTCYDGVTFHQQDFSITTEWERYSITFTPTAGTHNIYITSQQAVSWYAWGAQVELGLVATDYIETGATTAQAGILEDLPRLDYSGGASCPSLLLEPQRSNLVTQSEYALDSSWTTQLGTLTANAATSPEGVDNAVKFLEDSSGGRHRTFTSHNTNAGTYCVSVFMKDGNRGYGFLHWAMEGGDGRFSIVVDLSDGQVVDTMNFSGAEVIVDYGTEDYGNGWYRAYIVGTKASSNVSYVNFGLASSDNDTNSSGTPYYTGDGTHYAYFYGMQTEAGSYPTSYIPTYGSAVTRSLDQCELLGMNASGISTSNNWTYFIDVDNFESGQQAFYLRSTSAELIHLYHQSLGYRNSSNSSSYPASWSWSSYSGNNSQVKMCIRYDGNELSVFINGSKKSDVIDSSLLNNSFYYPFDQDKFHFAGDSKWDTNQKLFFDTALTDSECIALTTI